MGEVFYFGRIDREGVEVIIEKWKLLDIVKFPISIVEMDDRV